jgi:hypothetical protein
MECSHSKSLIDHSTNYLSAKDLETSTASVKRNMLKECISLLETCSYIAFKLTSALVGNIRILG